MIVVTGTISTAVVMDGLSARFFLQSRSNRYTCRANGIEQMDFLAGVRPGERFVVYGDTVTSDNGKMVFINVKFMIYDNQVKNNLSLLRQLFEGDLLSA